MKKQVALFWFRNDLRLKDNAAIQNALKEGYELVFWYCFEDTQFEHFLSSDVIKTNTFRYEFIRQSLSELREEIRALGGELFIEYGKTENLLPKFCENHQIKAIFASKEVAWEEIDLENKLEENNPDLSFYWKDGVNYLVNDKNLKFDISNNLKSFSSFRKKVEKYLKIEKTDDLPIKIFKLESNQKSLLKDLGEVYGFKNQLNVNTFFKGGEKAAWQRMNYYFFQTQKISQYKETRNELLGNDFSSHFSPWLAIGNISPTSIYFQLKNYEENVKKNESTYWLYFELLWREYFRLLIQNEPVAYFQLKGIQKEKPYKYWQKESLWQNWKNGYTGVPLIDANMKELNTTGFMSNRGRQIVASFLINDYQLDWRLGAEYFQSMLIDYDVHNNWGNWAYLAGVGNDPRGNRYFNIEIQGKRYDAEAKFIKHFLPELADENPSKIHEKYQKRI